MHFTDFKPVDRNLMYLTNQLHYPLGIRMGTAWRRVIECNQRAAVRKCSQVRRNSTYIVYLNDIYCTDILTLIYM